MRIPLRSETRNSDMTSMIDIVFLLIAFFIFLINFSEAEQDQRIKLPESELAIPSPLVPADAMTLQMMADGRILFNSREFILETIDAELAFESRVYQQGKIAPGTITVLLRADERCTHGDVASLMKRCRAHEFANFKLLTIAASAERY